jgi:hypothetical protein
LQIDRVCVEGQSYNRVSRRFGVSAYSIAHHTRFHLSRQLVQAYQQKSQIENMNLLGRIDKILLHAENIFERNYNRRRDLVALKALAEQRCTIDMLARISMYLHEARAAELQAAQGRNDEQEALAQAEFTQLICDRLDAVEVDLWLRLCEKINGETDEPVRFPTVTLESPTTGCSSTYPALESATGDYSSKPTATAVPPLAPRRTQFGLRYRSAKAIPRPASNPK